MFQDDNISGYEIADRYAPFPSVLTSFIGGVLCPYHRLKRLAVRWGLVLEYLVMKGRRFSWGSYMLAHLYKELHQVVYLECMSLLVGVTLIQVWAWEHIVVTRPLVDRDKPICFPYVFGYTGVVV